MPPTERGSIRASRRRRSRRRRAIAAGAGLAVVATSAGIAVASSGARAAGRVVATAVLGTVTQTVESSGTISASSKVTPSFAVSGTVKTVRVTVGQSVKAGDVLATLDTTSLQAAVDTAASTLASAQQKLESDRTGQASAASGQSAVQSSGVTTNSAKTTLLAGVAAAAPSAPVTATPPTTPSTSPAPTAPTAPTVPTVPTGPSTPTGPTGQVTAAQNAVIAAQTAVDGGQIAVDAAQRTVDADVRQNLTLRDAQKTACATTNADGSVTDACKSASADYETYADTLSAAMDVLDKAITAQDGNLATLRTAISNLDSLVTKLLKSAASTTSSSGTRSGATGSSKTSGRTGSTTTGGAPASGGAGANTGTAANRATQAAQSAQVAQPASASQLAADQASIDAAAAELDLARQHLAAASLTSPIAGRVGAIGLVAGTSSSGKTVTVLGTGVQQVTASVSLAQVDQVKAGQRATVSADGVTTPLHGTVVSRGLLSTTSGGRTTFPVTVRLDASSAALFDGTGADVVITTGAARNVLTVPNSAIHAGAGGRHTVTVVAAGRTSTVRVTVGLIGSDVSQVTSGLTAGQQVLLADLSTGLPSSTSTVNTRTFFRNGGRLPTGLTRTGG